MADAEQPNDQDTKPSVTPQHVNELGKARRPPRSCRSIAWSRTGRPGEDG